MFVEHVGCQTVGTVSNVSTVSTRLAVCGDIRVEKENHHQVGLKGHRERLRRWGTLMDRELGSDLPLTSLLPIFITVLRRYESFLEKRGGTIESLSI